jgi:hypothetical protein
MTRTYFSLGLLILSAGALGGQTFNQTTVKPVNVIIDSDLSHNADDAGDHAVLWALAARGEANVLAVIISATNDYSAATAQAIASYYGHPKIPIGATQGTIPGAYGSTFSYYTQQVAQNFGFPGKTRNYYPDAVTVYRQALAGAPDHSVYIVANGYYWALENLLLSTPDSISPLSGVQLVIQKVKQLVIAGGRFPDSFDNDHGNLSQDSDSANYLVSHWPVDLVWIPDDQVDLIMTGPAANADDNTNPVKLAYDLYCSYGLYCDAVTPAWGQAALLYAIRGGVGTNFSIGGQNGSTVVWGSNTSIPGRSIWSQSPNTHQGYLLRAVDSSVLAGILNPLLQWNPPGNSIKQPPVATSQSIVVTGGATPVTLLATDPQGAALTYTIATPPAHGTLTGTAPSLTYTPAAGYIGTDSFTFWAANQFYQSNIATVSITVNPTDRAPVANSQTVNSDGSGTPITLIATDPDNDPLTYLITAIPTHGVVSGTAPNLTYTPNAGFNGADTFQFQANDGVLNSNIATVSIVVNTSAPPYHLRLNAGGGSITDAQGNIWQADTTYGDPLSYTYSTMNSIATGAGDARLYQTERYGSNTLTYSIPSLPNGAYTVNLYFAEIYSGCFYAGCRVFDVNVQGVTVLHDFDVYAAAGAGNVGIARSTGATVTNGTLTITLQGTLTPFPTISALEVVRQAANGSGFGSISGTVIHAGTNAVIPGATVAYGTQFTITDNNGQYLLTHVPIGTYSVTASALGYQNATGNVTVVSGGTSTANLALTGGITQPPVANSQSVSTAAAAVAITLTATDPQNAALTYTVSSQPAHGTLAGTAPNLTYTPAAGYVGADSFTFQAANQLYTSNIATVSIQVNTANQAPVANAQTLTTDGASVNIVLTATDANGNLLTYSVTTLPTHGTLAGTAPNLVYTPSAGFNGTDTFQFRANDGTVNSNVATVTVVVDTTAPPFHLRLNAGGASITDAQGNVWQADTAYSDPTSYTFSTTDAIGASAGDVRLYQTERYGSNSLTYVIPNLPNGAYTVNLYFAEIYSGCFDAGCRVFDVNVQGATVLANFDVYAAAGGGDIGVARSINATVTNGTLTITLQGTLAPYPTISAIEVVRQAANTSSFGSITGTVLLSGSSAPLAGASVSYGTNSTVTDNNGRYLFTHAAPGSYTVTASARGYQSVTRTSVVTGNSTTTSNFSLGATPFALRVNAGGPSITDGNGNVWQADTGYTGGTPYSTTASIAAATGSPALYQTERYASGPLQYVFSGIPNGTYSVNLYFAEIATSCFSAGCRVFDIQVQGNTIAQNFDVYATAGGGNIGIVRQATASVTNGTLTITLQAGYSQYPTISAIEAIRQ